MLLLDRFEGVIEELSLVEVLLEFSSSYTLLDAFDFEWVAGRMMG